MNITWWHRFSASTIAQRAPDDKPDVPRRVEADLDTLQIRRRPVLNGLINECTHAA